MEIRQRLADANPTVTTFQADLAVSHNNIGNLQVKTGHPDDAMWSFTRSLAIRQRLANANPTVSAFRDRLATTHYNIGLLQSQTGHLKDALRSHRGRWRSCRSLPTLTRPSLSSRTIWPRSLAVSVHFIAQPGGQRRRCNR